MPVRIGTSGWSYPHWADVFYPKGLSPDRRLTYYGERFDTVELNASHYRWPVEATFAGWRRRLPEGFVLSVKAPRGLTHARRLHDPEPWLTRIEHGLTRLGTRRGVLLIQLPPSAAFDRARLTYFLQRLPPGLRVSIEFRHASWHQEVVFDLLEAYGVAYCVMSGARLPCHLKVTASFAYVRLHGPDHHHLYAGSYSDDDLHWWADRIREWQSMGREVFAYFNNDGNGHAVHNALRLKQMVGA